MAITAILRLPTAAVFHMDVCFTTVLLNTALAIDPTIGLGAKISGAAMLISSRVSGLPIHEKILRKSGYQLQDCYRLIRYQNPNKSLKSMAHCISERFHHVFAGELHRDLALVADKDFRSQYDGSPA